MSAARFLVTVAILLLFGCVANVWHFRSAPIQLAAKYKPELVAMYQSSPPVSEMPTDPVMQPFKRLEPFAFDRACQEDGISSRSSVHCTKSA
jgi:hypothetical protein